MKKQDQVIQAAVLMIAVQLVNSGLSFVDGVVAAKILSDLLEAVAREKPADWLLYQERLQRQQPEVTAALRSEGLFGGD